MFILLIIDMSTLHLASRNYGLAYCSFSPVMWYKFVYSCIQIKFACITQISKVLIQHDSLRVMGYFYYWCFAMFFLFFLYFGLPFFGRLMNCKLVKENLCIQKCLLLDRKLLATLKNIYMNISKKIIIKLFTEADKDSDCSTNTSCQKSHTITLFLGWPYSCVEITNKSYLKIL